MNVTSEKLHVYWDGSKTLAPNRSGLYWNVFTLWWEITTLNGNGLIVGDEYPNGANLKSWLAGRHSMINNIFLASLSNSDINWDITTPLKTDMQFDFIICQAVLEHVKDPVSAVRNLGNVLTPNRGFLYLHSHGPKFKEHRHPIDCYRFLRDGVIALAELAELELVDILYTESHWFSLMRKAT